MEKLVKDDKINLWMGRRSAVDMALRGVVEANLKTSEVLKHRILLGELVLRGITPIDLADSQACAVQLLAAKGV